MSGDAKTGRILWGHDQPTRHIHSSGLCADIDPEHPGSECYSGERDLPEKRWLRDCKGRVLSTEDLGGLAPRAVFLVVAALRVRAERRGASLDHAEFARLRGRLKRPHVETRAPEADPDGPRSTAAEGGLAETVPLAEGPLALLVWSGVGLEEATLGSALEARFGARPAAVHEVGGLDTAGDRVVLDGLRAQSANWAEYTDPQKRQAALERFHAYAYQWY